MLPLQEALVLFLVGKLTTYMPQGTAKKEKKEISVYRWVNSEEIFHLKKVSNYLVSHTALKRSQLGIYQDGDLTSISLALQR